MTRLTIGIIGCGLVAQVEHLPNLLGLGSLFDVIGVVDPSAKVRAHLSERYGVAAYAEALQLFARNPDCVVISTPDAYHVDLTLAALARGIHVFVEKPLCYSPAEAERVARARDAAGKVVQVGYMKRFDPAFVALCDLLKAQTTGLKAIAVEVHDPDFWPFVAHRDVFFGDDIPAELIAENGQRRAAQIAAALGGAPPADIMKGFAGPLCSSLVHDVNLLHGALEVIGLTLGQPGGTTFFNGDSGVAAMAQVVPTGAPVTLGWHAIPKLAHYGERLIFTFEDAVLELRFPSPYLNHQPTELIERRSNGLAYRETLHRPSYAEAFVEEMRGFHAAVEGRGAVINSVEAAGADMALLVELGRMARSA